MNIHNGRTGHSIRTERNWKINAPKPPPKNKHHKLRRCPNPLTRRLAIWKHRFGVI